MVIKRKINYQDDDELLFQAHNTVALRCTKANGQFFIAELLDDVTQSMLDDSAASVNVLYYDKKSNGKFKLRNYDVAPVRSIMCVIELHKVDDTEFELPRRYQQRINRVLKCVATGKGIGKGLNKLLKLQTPINSSEPAKKPQKLKKLVSGKGKCYVHLEEEAVDDEMHGNHGFREIVQDVLSSSKEVIRAVLTKNYPLLESLTSPTSPHIAHIHSHFAYRSVGIPKCALEYAIENNDIKAIELLLRTKDNEYHVAPKPTTSLRSVILKQECEDGSNEKASLKSKAVLALTEDHKPDAPLLHISNFHTFSRALWMASYDIFSLFNFGDDLINSDSSIITKLFYCGNIEVALKLMEILVNKGQAGYTHFHLQALQSTPIETFSKEEILSKSAHGVTPLHLAALNPCAAHLEQFLKKIEVVDFISIDILKWRPIHFAAASPSSASIKVLLRLKVSLLVQCNQGTPLHVACLYGRLDTLKLLLEHIPIHELITHLEHYNADGYRPLHIAAKYGFTPLVNLLLEYGATVRAQTNSNANNMTPLALAAEAGHLECVITLLNHGAPVDAVDATLRTPLIYVVMNGHATIARVLLNYNADANAADRYRNTVMHYAASYGWLSCVKLLLSIAAESWSLNAADMSPQVCAALLCRYDVSHFLLDHLNDRSIDYTNDDGATPLFLQCQYGNSAEEINYLLSKGADPNCCTKAELYPLQQILLRMAMAKDSDRPFFVDAVRQLLAHGAHTSGEELEINKLPLVLAIEAKSVEAMESLLPLSVVTDDTWIAVAKSPASDILFKPLLESPHTISNGGPVLHAIATSCQLNPLSCHLLDKILTKISDAEDAFLYYDDYGNLPIFTSMLNLRRLCSISDPAVDYVAKDVAASDLFKAFLEHTKDITSLTSFNNPMYGERQPTTQNLLHFACNQKLRYYRNCEGPSSVWNGINFLDKLLQSTKWPLDKVNADYYESTPLLLATLNENIPGLIALIANGADVNYKSPTMTTALRLAISNKMTEIVEILLKGGANPSMPIPALHTALQEDFERRRNIKILLDYGADICGVDDRGRTVVGAAIASRQQKVRSINVFEDNLDYSDTLNKPMQDEWDFAHCPCASRPSYEDTSLDYDLLDLLFNDANISKAIDIPDYEGKTCFDYAKQNHDVQLQRILRLISNKPCKSIPDPCQWTFDDVHAAICSHQWQQAFDVITNLIDSNRSTMLHQLDENNETLIHTMTRQNANFCKNMRAIAWLLVEAGVSLTARNGKQQTALHLAASRGRLPFCHFLLHHAPQLLDQACIDGNTALNEFMSKAIGGSFMMEGFIYFLRQGANITIKNHSGHSPLSIYIDRNAESQTKDNQIFLHLVQRLLERGADTNGLFSTACGKTCSRHGSVKPRLTLLMRALYCQSVHLRQELLVMLLAYQCNRMEVDDEGNTALHHAIALNLTEEVQLLLRPQLTFDNGDCVAKQCELSTDQLSAFVNAQNAFGESPLHIVVCPRHESSFENTEIALLLMNAGAKLDTVDKDGKSPVDLAMEQPSGVMYTALTKKVLPKTTTIQQFADIPDIAKDAAAFMSESQALGYIKSTPLVPTPMHTTRKSSVYVHPLTGKVYDTPMISVESQPDYTIASHFYRMQIVCDIKKFKLVAQSSLNGGAAYFDSTTYLDISKAMEAFHNMFKDKTGNDFVCERYTNIPGKFTPIQLPATIKEYDDSVLAPFTVNDATCSLPLPVQQALHKLVNINNLNEALTKNFSSMTTLTLAELQPALLQDAINLLTTIRSLVVTKDKLFNTLKNTPSPALQEQWNSTIYKIVEKSAQYFQWIRRRNGIHVPFLGASSIDIEKRQLHQLLQIGNANQVIIAAKQSTLHPLEYCYKGLQISLEESSSAEFDAISSYFSNGLPQSCGAFDNNKLKLSRVFKLARRAEVHRPTNNTTDGSSMLLWHDTTPATLMQTLQNGLQAAPLEGSSHRGISFRDTSLGCLESCKNNSSTSNNEPQYLLLCEIDMGAQVDDCDDKAGCSTFIPGQRQPNPKDAMVFPALGSCKVPLFDCTYGYSFGMSWFIYRPPLDTKFTSGFRSLVPTKELHQTATELILSFAQEDEWTFSVTQKDVMEAFDILQHSPEKLSIEFKAKKYLRSGRIGVTECFITLLGKDGVLLYSFVLHGIADAFGSGPKQCMLSHRCIRPAHNQHIVYDANHVKLKYLVEIHQAAKV